MSRETINHKQIMTKEKFDEAIMKMQEDQDELNRLLVTLFQITEYEKLDGVMIRISKIKAIKDIVENLHSSIETCECMISEYILSEAQKLKLDEYLESCTNNLMWFAVNNK